ncbi:hypothetical protein Acr_28g0014670 [Actinidia rufa]|uniref:Uncharacterized protein n=1 Tax=Actinidia rufa TaxID=165716 RepID=A0A7J0HCM1_9ERIC|nr:hypothetical protein Acr_28g0014670 [Actinidia rufa]
MASSRRRMLADRGSLKLMDLKLPLEENMSNELESMSKVNWKRPEPALRFKGPQSKFRFEALNRKKSIKQKSYSQ